jgi:CRP-like cAMP-binding protein
MSTPVIDSIIDGSITIDTPEAFNSIIQHYRDNPDLLCLYANFLEKNNRTPSAVEAYERATKICIDSGKLIQAIMSQTHKWRLSRPDMEEIDSFFSIIKNINNNHHPFNDFFDDLFRSEKLQLMLNFEQIVFPAKTIIIKPGRIEDAIFFVISGELKESFYQLLNHREKYQRHPIRILKENDQLGQIYPYTQEIKSQSFVESITRVQLAKLSKDNLIRLCQKFPRIEKGIIKLCNIRSTNAIPGSEINIRKSNRYPIKVKLKVKVLSIENGEPEFTLSGYSKDLSLTGVGFVSEECSKELKDKIGNILERDEKRKIRLILYGDNISISISGELVRLQEIIQNGRRTIVLGIQFEKMPPNLQGLLFSAAKIFSTLK